MHFIAGNIGGEKMCEWGDTVTYEVFIPAHLSSTGEDKRKNVDIDRCLLPLVKALNESGILTDACCCGHGKRPGNIMLADDRVIEIYPNYKEWRKATDILDFPPIN